MNETTLVCYEQDIVNCQYKSIDNTLPAKRFFLTMPPAPSETNINPNLSCFFYYIKWDCIMYKLAYIFLRI